MAMENIILIYALVVNFVNDFCFLYRPSSHSYETSFSYICYFLWMFLQYHLSTTENMLWIISLTIL